MSDFQKDHDEGKKEGESVFGTFLSLNPAFPKVNISREQTVIGRRRDCDCRILDLRISGRHALVNFEPSTQNFFIQDMSTNGTWINGVRLSLGKPTLLNHGDELSLLPPTLNSNQDGDDSKKAADDDGLFSEFGLAFVFHDRARPPGEHLVVEMGEAGVQAHHEFLKPLGQGTFGEVWLTRERASGAGGRLCAAKVMCKRKYVGLTGNLENIFAEVKILSRLQHPNVCRVLDSYETPKYLVIMLELARGGDLGDLIQKHPAGMPEQLARQCFLQIIEALDYLHSENIAHRDLKPDNILISGSNKQVPVLKLTDFGLSRLVGSRTLMKTVCGTPFYLPPEVVRAGLGAAAAGAGSEGGYDKRCDVWSAGVVLYQLLTGRLPVRQDPGAPPLHRQILEVLDQNFVLPVPANCGAESGFLLQRLLTGPKDRWSAAEASRCRWLRPEAGAGLKRGRGVGDDDDAAADPQQMRRGPTLETAEHQRRRRQRLRRGQSFGRGVALSSSPQDSVSAGAGDGKGARCHQLKTIAEGPGDNGGEGCNGSG